MISIDRISDSTKDKVCSFLKSVPSIEMVDSAILDNAVIVLEGEKVVGCISFEVFGNTASTLPFLPLSLPEMMITSSPVFT